MDNMKLFSVILQDCAQELPHLLYNIYLLTIYLIIMHQTQLEERIDFINYENIIAKSYGIVKSRIIEEKESERRILLLFNLN